MAKLPTAFDLGPLPSARSGRIIANYDTSAAGRGMADLGQAISGASANIAKLGGEGGRGTVSQAERFETNRRFLEFVSAQEQAYEESKNAVDPGAMGFRETTQDTYLKGAKDFFSTVPDALKPEFDYKLFTVEDDFITKSGAFETLERTRYYGEEVDKGLSTIEAGLFSNPANFDQNYAQGVEYINTVPDEHLSRLEKANLTAAWRRKAQLAALNGMSPQERKRMLGWAPDAPDVKPSGARASAVTRSIPGDVRKTISDAAQRHGVDPNALLTIAWLESRGNSSAKNPNSSAGGLFQFIDSTANAYGLTNKFDPAQSADAGARLARDNSLMLERVLGRKPTAGELYLAHQQGAGGAARLLSNPTALAVDVVGSDAVRLNGGTEGMTAGEFASLWLRKAGDTRVPNSSPAGGRLDPERADPRFADMPWQDQAKIVANADKEIISYERIIEQQEALQEKRLEEIQVQARHEATKTGYDLAVDDELTPEWVEEHRDILTVSDYKTLVRAAHGEDSNKRTPPKEYIRLLDLADEDPEQAIEQVRDLYGKDIIAKDVFNKIYAQAQSNLRAADSVEKYDSETRQYVRSMLRPESDAPRSHVSRQLDAAFAFDDWLESHPNANRAEMRDAADTIIKNYREMRYRRDVSTIPQPRYLDVSQPVTPQAIEKAKRDTLMSIRFGRLTVEEAAEQARLLKTWATVIKDAQ